MFELYTLTSVTGSLSLMLPFSLSSALAWASNWCFPGPCMAVSVVPRETGTRHYESPPSLKGLMHVCQRNRGKKSEKSGNEGLCRTITRNISQNKNKCGGPMGFQNPSKLPRSLERQGGQKSEVVLCYTSQSAWLSWDSASKTLIKESGGDGTHLESQH